MYGLKILVLAGVIAAAPLLMAHEMRFGSTTPRVRNRVNIEARQRHQQRRIAQGIRSGQLTPAEAARLEQREARIERREQRMRASGGTFTLRERATIHRQLNRASRQIYLQKHDRQYR